MHRSLHDGSYYRTRSKEAFQFREIGERSQRINGKEKKILQNRV